MKQANVLSVRKKYTLGGIIFGLSFPIFSQIMDCLLNGLPYSIESILIIHQQNVIHYVVDTAPIVLGLAGFLLGKTHQKKNSSNERLAKINESLDTLTYKITHDLRGPALNIKNLTDILVNGKQTLDDQKRDIVTEKIQDSINTWLSTFEDFMSLLKHEKSGELEKKECSLSSTIDHLRLELNNEIEESSARINTDFAQIDKVFGSEDYLRSIFKNLITNAIKYAHNERKPEINISSDIHQNQTRIKFSDNGTGIDMETFGDKIFKLFERIHNKSGVSGSGVGLYLVKEQVEKQNGSIEVESILNEGTIFTIYLPYTS